MSFENTYELAIVNSMSTPGKIPTEVIFLTISDVLVKSMIRLWIRIWNRSQVFEPSPQGVLRVVILSVFVGSRTGPFTLTSCSLAARIRSEHTGETD